jgi:amino acid adenylation domain-containing protein
MPTPTFTRLGFHGLQQSAQRHPQKIAVVADGQRHTYAELENDSNRLAAALLARGIGRGERIAIYLENSWPAILAVYTSMKIGAIFVVINPQTKSQRLQAILTDAQVRILFSDSRLAEIWGAALPHCPHLSNLVCTGDSVKLAAINSRGLTIEAFDEYLASGNKIPACDTLISTDVCALIYTSGTTGTPKGVMHSHQSMVFVIGSIIEYLQLSAEDKILSVLPMAFSYGLYQVFISVFLGATIILERSFAFPAQIFARIEAESVNVFPAIPTMLSLMATTHRKTPLRFNGITRVTNAGAALPGSLIASLQEIFPQAKLYKMYGQTECNRVCYLDPQLAASHPDSVGKAIPGTEVFLMNENGVRLPPGSEGILHVRGPHLMLGYWNQPELTAQTLKPGSIPGERILCTHDWFQMDEQGLLYFKGRSDDIIKTRGEKVSPTEIENALLAMDDIHEAAVIGVADEHLGQTITAFVVSDNAQLNDRLIKKFLMSKLENFMIPKDIYLIAELPKSVNGKIDKKQLFPVDKTLSNEGQ